MYKVDPLYDSNCQVTLPTCMYKMESIYNDGTSYEDDDDVHVENVLKRQKIVISALEELKKEVLKFEIKHKLAYWEQFVSEEEKRDLYKGVKYTDIVINADPNRPPYSVQLICDLLSKNMNVNLTTYVHSTLKNVPKEVKKFPGITCSGKPDLTVNLIFKTEKDEFHDSDKNLTRYVKFHQDDLAKTIQSYRKASSRITVANEKCKHVKNKLIHCKKLLLLLHCKHDIVKSLWLTAVGHRRHLHTFQEIENFLKIQSQIELFMNSKMYLEATQAIVSSIAVSDTSLCEIDALKEIRKELYSKREILSQSIVFEFNKVLYTKHDGLKSKENSTSYVKQSNLGKKMPKISNKLSNSECGDHIQKTKSEISCFVNCICLLDRIEETVQFLKEKCTFELWNIITQTAQSVSQKKTNYYNYYYLNDQNKDKANLFLSEWIELVLEQFKCVIEKHGILVHEFKERKIDCRGYEVTDVWNEIQAVLTMFLRENFFDIQNRPNKQPNSETFNTERSNFFKKKQTQTKCRSPALFKFENSLLSVKSYLEEYQNFMRKVDIFDEKSQVFGLSSKNVSAFVKLLSKFIEEISEELDIDNNGPLANFLANFLTDYLKKVNDDIGDTANRSLENWNFQKKN